VKRVAYASIPAVILLAEGILAFSACGSSSKGDHGPSCQGACFDAMMPEAAPPDLDVADVKDGTSGPATCTSLCATISSLKGCPDPGCAGTCARSQALCTSSAGLILFQSLLNCEATATYECSTGSPPLPVTGDCKSAAAAVARECTSAEGGGLEGGCAVAGTSSACTSCCAGMFMEGADTYGLALKHCACASPGACLATCATTECAAITPSSGSACGKCLASSLAPDGSCEQPLSEACGIDPNCLAYEKCLKTSGCNGK
jgi:hypothetical protein